LLTRSCSLGGGFEQRLFILYLVNDVLLHSARAKQDGMADYYIPAFQSAISDISLAVFKAAGTDEQREKVLALLNIWAQKAFYSQDFLGVIRERLVRLG
jgi:hypothetical protein